MTNSIFFHFQLLVATLIALFFFGVRIVYTVVATFSGSSTLNPSTGSLAVRVCLRIVPEMLATVAFVAAGLLTRNIKHEKGVDSTTPISGKQPRRR